MQNTRPTLPPEWSPQSAVMLTWPHAHGDWREHLSRVEPVFVQIARVISRHEQLVIAAHDAAHLQHAHGVLRASGADMRRIHLFQAPSNDTWARDHGPITALRGGKPCLLDFTFNGWGGKFEAGLDNQITQRLHELGAFGKTPLETIPFVLEGGSIEVDGAGALLTTSRCLLAPTRNPGVSRQEIETRLKEWLGVERVLWLEHGHLAGDDTDSHVDTLARFCNADTICYVACDDSHDEHYAELKLMQQELKQLHKSDGTPYQLVPLPWPRAKYGDDGRRLPATYANFLIINRAVLVPTYDDPSDNLALERIRQCFPERDVIGIPCSPLILQHGSLHCVTMQLPAGVL